MLRWKKRNIHFNLRSWSSPQGAKHEPQNCCCCKPSMYSILHFSTFHSTFFTSFFHKVLCKCCVSRTSFPWPCPWQLCLRLSLCKVTIKTLWQTSWDSINDCRNSSNRGETLFCLMSKNPELQLHYYDFIPGQWWVDSISCNHAVRNHASWSSSLPSLNLNSVRTCFDSAIRLLLILNSSQSIRTPLFSPCWIVLLVTLGLSELSRLFNFWLVLSVDL